ncbi:MAG: TraB/GumN family protein, partial [Burkholderiales bacterium]|nr:TraB/GumN family protein [Burkholderiales bacterium]
LAQVSKSGTPAERFVKEQLFEGRHPRMVAEIEKLAAGGKPAVVAVGALHYFGPKGLLEMLKQRGWTITQIK